MNSTAALLNRHCACRTLNSDLLHQQLDQQAGYTGLSRLIASTRPHLFSSTAVFMSQQQMQRIQAVIDAIVSVVALPQYQQQVLADAPAIARPMFGPAGVFMGYDFHLDNFHLDNNGVHLIEINTNAGGPLLNAVLARSQQASCGIDMAPAPDLETTFYQMFVQEWQSQRGDAVLKTVAIVDDKPLEQYLYPEFLLFQKLFRDFGLEAIIVDAADLQWRDGKLWHAGQSIDLVYNRLTDFYLQDSRYSALANAYLQGDVVLTPHPHAHALYANKFNLALLSQPQALSAMGVDAGVQQILADGIPLSQKVTSDNGDSLWHERKQWFFKPAMGYGGKAAYRGEKLTKRVWGEILQGDYIAQQLVMPGERLIQLESEQADLKLDVRAYTYRNRIQLLAARLYSGQTTNFRTPGGGFAPVFLVEDVNCPLSACSFKQKNNDANTYK